MKSPCEIESERIAVGFAISFVIIAVIAVVFHKELISYLSIIMIKLNFVC